MAKMNKILKVINILFTCIIAFSLVWGLWFWHEVNVAKERHKLIEDALMGIAFDSSDSYANLREDYLPQFAGEEVWGELFPPEPTSTLDGNTVRHIDAQKLALSTEEAYINMSKEGNFVANLRVASNRGVHFSIFFAGTVDGDGVRFTKMY
ncbi:hypothetical protein SAMN04487830_1629 [Pseudobutyrivibrio sp. OR37]|nr:hypothetical protein SAMN04487830_1629 [Pseudobutyrivibrio sp. OR37]